MDLKLSQVRNLMSMLGHTKQGNWGRFHKESPNLGLV